MKNLPFDDAAYRQYKNTFLASVLVAIKYPAVQDAAAHKIAWAKYTQEAFSVDALDGIFKKPIVINRSDDKLKFLFGPDLAQVLISGDGYRNFVDTVVPHTFQLKEFVSEVAGCQKPKMVGIRKINIFQIESVQGQSFDEKMVRKQFLSEKYLVQQEGCVQLNADEQVMPNMIKHEWTDEDSKLTMRTVFMVNPQLKNRAQLVLDTEEMYAPARGIELGQIDKSMKDINTDLYKAYMWCVSDYVKKIMMKERS